MKSSLSLIWSSVIPMSISSFSSAWNAGSGLSSEKAASPFVSLLGTGGGRAAGVAARRESLLLLGEWVRCSMCGMWAVKPEVERPPLDFAYLFRASTFLWKVAASFSSAKEKPAMQFSSSKVWKNVLSWLYLKPS